jgi:uncharacterized RDD family membrane protein YckC
MTKRKSKQELLLLQEKIMETIDISTGQHVTILFRPAGAFERALATVLDWIVQYFYTMAIVMLNAFIMSSDPLFWYENQELKIVIVSLLMLPVAFYGFLFEAFMHGQTLGKKLLKIRVTNVDGSTTSISGYFLRWLIRPVDFLPLGGIVGALFIHFTGKKQRIGDLAAGTIVVGTKQKAAIRSEYYTFEEDYAPLYPQVDCLSEAQIGFIIKHLDLPDKWHRKAVEELADKVRTALETDSDLPARDFLMRVVRDYNYYASMGI